MNYQKNTTAKPAPAKPAKKKSVKKAAAKGDKLQGEGDRESAARYREHLDEYLETADTEAAAERARKAVEENPEEFEAAERKGKKAPVKKDWTKPIH